MRDVPGNAFSLNGMWAFADYRRASLCLLDLRFVLGIYSLVEGSPVKYDWAVCLNAASKIRGITLFLFSTRRSIPAQAFGLK
jgi:hypothetical protein